ncbi:hypothetical protein [Burkholderia aenigmatica]|uniref:hypothetical protein n=1 Tax=Burkholderia aenigmatica TaxID=2015348 RepID=UPI0026509F26|nr:hypothetical protein [Burkholderia aenigmatica]MDN7881100.1 hypothetical protein [Burkholderia aenigmatica]
MSKLNFGTVDRCSVRLDTATLLGLKAAYEDFAKTGQDLRNFEICIEDRKASKVDPGPDDDVIIVTFTAKLIPGMRGLGNANRLGKSIEYVISPATGDVLEVFGTK